MNNRLVVIGGSAGSVRFLCDLLPKLRADIQVPICIAVHRSPETKSKLKFVFESYSSLPVHESLEETELNNGQVYLAPPDNHMLIVGNQVRSEQSGMVHYSRPSIDVLFSSAAEAYRENLTAILITGANDDGANGMAMVDAYKGTTIVQDPSDALIDYMPKSALERITPSFVLDKQGIIDYLNKQF